MSRLRLPASLLFVIGPILFLLALMGITNSVHAIAKIVYAIVMLAGLGCGVLGFRKRKAASRP